MSSDARSDRPPAGLENYPGSKGGSGVYQRIISEIPTTRTYVEGFCGGAGVYRHMRRCSRSWLLDADPRVIQAWDQVASPDTTVLQGDFLELVSGEAGTSSPLLDAMRDPDAVVYLDPPYLDSTVRTPGLYRKWFGSDGQHRSLLRWATLARCRVLISGYWSPLYAEMLEPWRLTRYSAMTRGGVREECLWMNFAPPVRLHDARFVGGNYRERERIKRRVESWASMYRAMGSGEQQRVLSGLLAAEREASAALGRDRD